MGDRAVAGFREKSSNPETTIYLYQHWSGSDQITNFAYALEKARPRWSDSSYATRIMVSQLVNDQWESETGYGLYVGGKAHGADYHYILIADFEKQAVLVAENDNAENVLEEIPFDDFISNAEVLVANATMELDAQKQAEFFAKFPELAKAFTS